MAHIGCTLHDKTIEKLIKAGTDKTMEVMFAAGAQDVKQEA